MLGTCTSLGCEREITPPARELALRSELGCGTVALAWGLALVLCGLALVEPGRGRHRVAAVGHAAESIRPPEVATYKDLKLTIRQVRRCLDDGGLVSVGARIQNLGRAPATLSLNGDLAHARWIGASGEELVPRRTLRTRHGLVVLEPGDWIDETLTLSERSLSKDQVSVRLELDLDPRVDGGVARSIGGLLVSDEITVER
jgi:hypothetical protein